MHHRRGKRLLFVGGGEEAAPGVEHARRLGIHPVVLDRDEFSPGARLADAHLRASIFDVESAVRLAREESRLRRIDGVISVATEAPRTVAAIAEELRVPGIGSAAAVAVSDKLVMKKLFDLHGVRTARGRRVVSDEDARQFIRDSGRPVVMKPADSRGARGVSIVDVRSDVSRHFFEALSQSPSGRVLAEDFLPGPQFSTESVVFDGRITTVAVSTRNYERMRETYPYPIEDGGELPADLGIADRREMDDLLLAASSALGITRGTVKGDLVMSDGRLHVIEMAGRLSGGYFASHEIPISTGVDLLGAAFDLAFGSDLDPDRLRATRSVPVAQRYLFPEPGRVTSIHVPPWISEDPSIRLFVLRVGIGDVIPQVVNHPARAGLVICTGSDREHAVRRARAVVGGVRIVVESA